MPAISARPDPATERRQQILQAAMVSFARRGFHQTTMHDISDEAGISVGLIYRYFSNKDAVITAMADEHKREIHEVLARARQAPSLLDALEVIFTSHCNNAPHAESAFVVDLFAEAGRNPHVAELVRDVVQVVMNGVADLVASCPDADRLPANLTPRQIAELILAVNHGMLMHDVLETSQKDPEMRRRSQLAVLRNLWRLIFQPRSPKKLRLSGLAD